MNNEIIFIDSAAIGTLVTDIQFQFNFSSGSELEVTTFEGGGGIFGGKVNLGNLATFVFSPSTPPFVGRLVGTKTTTAAQGTFITRRYISDPPDTDKKFVVPSDATLKGEGTLVRLISSDQSLTPLGTNYLASELNEYINYKGLPKPARGGLDKLEQGKCKAFCEEVCGDENNNEIPCDDPKAESCFHVYSFPDDMILNEVGSITNIARSIASKLGGVAYYANGKMVVSSKSEAMSARAGAVSSLNGRVKSDSTALVLQYSTESSSESSINIVQTTIKENWRPKPREKAIPNANGLFKEWKNNKNTSLDLVNSEEAGSTGEGGRILRPSDQVTDIDEEDKVGTVKVTTQQMAMVFKPSLEHNCVLNALGNINSEEAKEASILLEMGEQHFIDYEVYLNVAKLKRPDGSKSIYTNISKYKPIFTSSEVSGIIKNKRHKNYSLLVELLEGGAGELLGAYLTDKEGEEGGQEAEEAVSNEIQFTVAAIRRENILSKEAQEDWSRKVSLLKLFKDHYSTLLISGPTSRRNAENFNVSTEFVYKELKISDTSLSNLRSIAETKSSPKGDSLPDPPFSAVAVRGEFSGEGLDDNDSCDANVYFTIQNTQGENLHIESDILSFYYDVQSTKEKSIIDLYAKEGFTDIVVITTKSSLGENLKKASDAYFARKSSNSMMLERTITTTPVWVSDVQSPDSLSKAGSSKLSVLKTKTGGWNYTTDYSEWTEKNSKEGAQESCLPKNYSSALASSGGDEGDGGDEVSAFSIVQRSVGEDGEDGDSAIEEEDPPPKLKCEVVLEDRITEQTEEESTDKQETTVQGSTTTYESVSVSLMGWPTWGNQYINTDISKGADSVSFSIDGNGNMQTTITCSAERIVNSSHRMVGASSSAGVFGAMDSNILSEGLSLRARLF